MSQSSSRRSRVIVHVACAAGALLAVRATAQTPQRIDSVYTAQIKALTPVDSRWKFSTELVDYMPYSATVPTPLKVLGYVPGTLGRLSRTADLNKYFRALAAASPRVKVFSGGMSDEGREMLVVAIADEATIAKLDDYRAKIARLADPRGLDSTTRAQLVHEAKPIYWLTGTIHAPETGSPEMLMELAYRLAVDESPSTRDIRSNVITLITPATEVDGRDRIVDVYGESQRLGLGPEGVPAIYWGKYVAHDNNRDAIVVSQKLTKNVMNAYLHWKPTVVHDLHESVPFLYISTGTGPYNEDYDAISVDEWNTLAYQEITELTRRGLPGIWTHGFYDGWAPNYTVLSIGNLHNSIGRFYETYTSSGAGCTTVRLQPSDTARAWYRSNPPVDGVKWCIRSNINFQQSGVLVALRYVADHRDVFLNNFVTKSERMIERGRGTAPYAFVIPRSQRHAAEAADLVNLFRTHGVEVQEATADFTATVDSAAHRDTTKRNGGGEDAALATPAKARSHAVNVAVHAGDWIIRLDQPYAAPARTLLAIQKYNVDDPTPYDDTGWTLDLLRGVETLKIADSSVFTRPMRMLTSNAVVPGTTSGTGSALVVRHTGDWRSAVLPWKIGGAKVLVADSAFTADGASYPAGTFFIQKDDAKLRDDLRALGVNAVATNAAAPVKQHAIVLPRIALVHTWLETQNEGWVRFAFEQMGIPFTYISTQTLAKSGALDRFDVVVFPHVSGPVTRMINGRPMTGPAIPWKTTARTPNIGKIDSTDDIRPGMGLDGAAALHRFVERGGLLITEGNSTRLPIDLGFTNTASIATTPKLKARGGIYRASVTDRTSPIVYGYESGPMPLYFNQAPVLTVTKRDTLDRDEGIDPAVIASREKQRARAVVSFVKNPADLFVSGLLAGGDELAGKAAVVDAPLGNGHIVMFGIRPMWRWETQRAFAMPINAIVNWNHL